MNQIIEHKGIIQNIQVNQIDVLISQKSACSECHAKSVCTVADKVEKIIEVESIDSSFKVGDEVILFGQQSIGLQAVFLSFVIPLVLILITLIVLKFISVNEVISAVMALLVPVLYYIVLSFFNPRLKNKFKFEIKKP